MNLQDIFSYTFMQRALVVGICTSLSASMLGVILILKRYAMIGDGLSHVAFGALAVSMVLGWSPLAVSLPVVVLAAFLLLRFNHSAKLAGDTSIAMIASFSLAVGATVTSLSQGMNADVSGYMFGSILALTSGYVFMSVGLSLVVIMAFILYQGRIFCLTFDENFSKASGVAVDRITFLLAILTACTVVIGIRIMGALLISSLIVFPPVVAMRWSRSFRGVITLSALFSTIGFILGLLLSYKYRVPTGASVVLIHGGIFFISRTIEFIMDRRVRRLMGKNRIFSR